jgi:2',3'-cyclic-nucleotide 2'-phosphodiesterase (5'-nucleotidase family)
MKNHSNATRAWMALLAVASAGHAWQTNLLYDFPQMPLIGEAGRTDTAWYFDSTKNADGVYARLAVPVREGGWSSLERDTTDPTGHTFWTINDRGLNIAHELGGRADKVFPFPGYHHKLLRVRIENGAVAVLSTDSIRSLEDASLFTTGLVSTKASTGETALRMRLDSAKVDTTPGNALSAVPYGYDFESVRRFGNSLFLSDEYGPFVVEVDLATLRIGKEWHPGHGLPEVLKKRRANRGMEAMAVTPSGKVVGILQSPMYNQAGGGNTNSTRDGEMVRMLWLDPVSGNTKEFLYPLDLENGNRRGRDTKVSEMVALSETRFLVLEQGVENAGPKLYRIDIHEIDIAHATDVSGTGTDGLLVGGRTLEELATIPGAIARTSIRPAAKRVLVEDLIRATPWTSEKPEGLAIVDDSTLAIGNDNDYGMTDYSGDGIPHILRADQIVPSIMYFRVPSLSSRLADSAFARPQEAAFRLTVLHNNDGESQLVDAGNGATDRGGIHRFKALVDTARAQAAAKGRQILTLTAGDNFLAGKEWQASLDRDPALPTYDGLALDRVGYDALCLGNHDFDFGPDTLARFIESFPVSNAPFLSANLGFADEPALDALADAGRIRSSIVVERAGQRIGIVGATTPTISYISSPRRTTIDTNVAAAIQKRVDSLVAAGVDMIVVVSHLQAVANDTLLAKKLKHVDIMLAGGGDELLGASNTAVQPGDAAPKGEYPLRVEDADGRTVYVVTAPGDYLYLGQLEADFDSTGEIVRIGTASGPRRVMGSTYIDGVGEDTAVKRLAVDPVAAYTAALATTRVGTSNVGLVGTRDSVRSRQTNLGSLSTDAMLWESHRMAKTLAIDSPRIAIQNGGGIRNNAVVPAGEISMATVFDIHPFGNLLSILPRVRAATLKDAFENAVRLLPATNGGFPQIAGARMWIDTTRAAAKIDAEGRIVQRGARVRTLVLGACDTIVKDGALVDSARRISVATLNFLALGGDAYPFASDSVVHSSVPQHMFLKNFVAQELGGTIDSSRYPLQAGRIHFVQGTTVGLATRRSPTLSLHRLPGRLAADLSLVEAGSASMELLDLRGRILSRAAEASLAAGPHRLVLRTASVADGLYILRIQAPGLRQTRSIQLLD